MIEDRLSGETLARVPADVRRPCYDRSGIRNGVIHLGIGAFHRAHQAVTFDDALQAGDERWGVVGVSLRSTGVRDQLRPQDGLYTVLERGPDGDRARVIGAVQDVLVAPEDPARVIQAMADPDVHIVTLTVTEKGYRLDPASRALNGADPDVVADLSSFARPRTAPGFLAAALAERRRRGLAPFSVISCDNLPENGARLRSAVLEMASSADAGLAEWIAAEGAFPQTMVDRIVPATTPDDVTALAARLGLVDQGLVKTETYSQWVIEDRFCGPRPDFEGLGVQLTPAVAPWEHAKLRLLNGAHSAIAYLGGLAGHAFVHDVVAVPAFANYVERLWDEAETTLNPPPGLDVAQYRRDLASRFRNSALRHSTRQIAMDGSQKLPQRLLATIEARLAKGLPIPALALAVAGWMRWQGGVTDMGQRFTVDDPLAAELSARLTGKSCEDAVAALLEFRPVMPESLAGRADLRDALEDACRSLASVGAAGAVVRLQEQGVW